MLEVLFAGVSRPRGFAFRQLLSNESLVAAAAAQFHFLQKQGASKTRQSRDRWQAADISQPSCLRLITEAVNLSIIESKHYHKRLKELRKMAKLAGAPRKGFSTKSSRRLICYGRR
jgi:hypothetical protein